jgi:hypothetical protein
MPKKPPQVDWNNLTDIWQRLWKLANGNPNELLTRDTLQKDLGTTIPPETTLGCLRSYHDLALIKCVKNDAVITEPEKKSDFDQFRLTGKAAAIGDLLTKENIR